MGVQDLWELLSPVGRRVSVETLAGKKLAIDASIWMVQFMKAMRDEKGEMVRNAHLLGFFRRICKLLFLRTRPVFVFDGGTPTLKRRTVAARQRHRENARAKIRKTAEKLLLNHLKAKKLEELAAEIKNSKAKDDLKGKHILSNYENDVSGTNVPKGTNENVLGAISQESLDEMLAASLAAEEEGKDIGNETTSTSEFHSEAELDEDDHEEMAVPEIDGNIDPTVLASLPPSMQLDLLVQMRERLMAENRQKYQKIKKSPSKFSELQIQSYLKTVAFRREIDEVQKFAAGRGPEGVQTSRIASEANREFIFSSSFTGDKKVFTSAGVEKNGNAGKTEACQGKESTSADSMKGPLPSSLLKSTDQVNVVDPTKDFGHDIATYLDERGRIRVSGVRGLGIRMTRDLERNLDLMREYEIENNEMYVHKNMEPICSKESLNFPHNCSNDGRSRIDREDNEKPDEDLNICHGASTQTNRKDYSYERSTVENETAIEVSFSVDDSIDRDDDLFSQLVAGSSTFQSSEVCSLGKSSHSRESEFDWEDGLIGKVTNNRTDNDNVSQASTEERVISENDELNWEQGEVGISPDLRTEHVKSVSRGSLEEESEIQEAIRRSLEDLSQRSDTISLLHTPASKKSSIDSFLTSLQHDSQENPTQHARIVDVPEKLDCTVLNCHHLQNTHSVETQCSTGVVLQDSTADVPSGKFQVSNHATQLEANDRIAKVPQVDKEAIAKVVEGQISQQESCLYTSNEDENKASLRTLTDVSVAGSSEVCVRREGKTGADLDGVHGTVLLDTYRISEEGKERDDITDDSVGLHTEILESTLDEELLLLSHERRDLGDEQRKLERNAESVNNEMFSECQELLQMFGLPYIIAPMEAEAQCAYMELMNLVDGVVTDDSDVFLFGAQNVYKNIFDDRKYVETYLMKDIENELGLTREKLIHMALLLGSDYTEGVSGIGIVNAIEVVRAFPEKDGLKKFREWVESPDPAILGKLYPHVDDATKKRLSKAKSSDGDGLGSDAEGSLSNGTQGTDIQSSSNDILEVKKTFMDTHRNVSKNWHIPSSFPSSSVVSAYTDPQVDESTESFTWGKPDLHLLRKLCWEKFGWPNPKADELLLPVLREYNKHETQLRLEAFYTFNEKFAKIRSQRIRRAVKGITGKRSSELTGDLEQGDVNIEKRGQIPELEKDGNLNNNDARCDSGKTSRLPKKAKPQKLSDERYAESLVQDQPTVNEENKSNVSGGRGRGRSGVGGWKGRKRAGGRGREKVHDFESSETSSSDFSYQSTEKEKQIEMTYSSELRRSVRQRKQVQYAEENNGSGDISDPPWNGEICVDEPAAKQETHHDSIMDGGNDDCGMGIAGDICGFSGSKSSTTGDYLLSGGGFCIDDNDSNCGDTQTISGTRENPVGVPEKTDTLGNQNMGTECSFDSNLKDIHEPAQGFLVTSVGHEETDLSTEQDEGQTTNYGFTAMASLRRKRR